MTGYVLDGDERTCIGKLDYRMLAMITNSYTFWQNKYLCFSLQSSIISQQTLMSVQEACQIVMRMLHVPILMAALLVLVTLVLLEMDSTALVCYTLPATFVLYIK